MGNSSDVCLGREHKGPVRYAELSPEEAYMLKRQQDLKLFIYTCQDLEQAFITNLHFHSINETEFIEILVKLKLLREDNPKDTVVWNSFYGRFRVDATEKGILKPYFDITSIMIAMYLLTSSKASVKAKYIGALFHEYKSESQDYEDQQIHNSLKKRIEQPDKKLDDNFKPSQNIKNQIMRKQHYLRKYFEINQIFTVFNSVSINLLPYFASDYPDNDKSYYYKLFCQWNKFKDTLTQTMIDNFCRSDSEIDVNEFIQRAAVLPQNFDVLGIREEIKSQIQIREQNLWRMDHKEEENNLMNQPESIEACSLPSRYSQAYLYKIISDESRKGAFFKDKQIDNESQRNTDKQQRKFVRDQISSNLMKNIQRSDDRIQGTKEVWEQKNQIQQQMRRDRASRNQDKNKIIHSPKQSQF
eukprot:403348212